MGAVAGAGLVAVSGAAPAQAAETVGGVFYSIEPFRYVDSRTDGGPISAGQTRLIDLPENAGITIYFNLTVVHTAGNGYLAVYDSDLATRPSPYSSINWQGAGKVVANFGLVPIGTAGFRVYCGGGSGARTNFIVDVVGISAVPPPAAAAKRDQLRRRLEAAKLR